MGSSSALKEWSHWLKTFENYVEVMDASFANGQPTDRLKALVNCISYQVYEYIEESPTYNTMIATVRDLFSKAPNEVFACHLLATAKQEPGHTLDEFLLSLQKLAKDCNFQAVTGMQYKQEMICDAFINGLISPRIRQRLLKHHELNLKTAVKACAMELPWNWHKRTVNIILNSPILFSILKLQKKDTFQMYVNQNPPKLQMLVYLPLCFVLFIKHLVA